MEAQVTCLTFPQLVNAFARSTQPLFVATAAYRAILAGTPLKEKCLAVLGRANSALTQAFSERGALTGTAAEKRDVAALFDLGLVEGTFTRPVVGVTCLTDCPVCPWPMSIADRFTGCLQTFTPQRSFRCSRDFARAWHYLVCACHLA